MSKIRIDKKDLIWSYIGNFLKLAINVILLPIILHYLSDEEMGMWYVFASIGQLIILLDFGFAPSLARNISYVWCGAKQLRKSNLSDDGPQGFDGEYFCIVLSTCKYIYVGISIVAIIILIALGGPYISSLSNNPTYLYAWVIYSIGSFTNILYSYYSSLLIGIGAIAENNKAGITAKLVQIIVTILTLSLGWGLIGVSLAYFLSGLGLRLSSRYYFYKAEEMKAILKNVHIQDKITKCKEAFQSIWHNASRDGLVTLSNYLSTQANTLICSSVLGLTTTGSYGLCVQISTIVSSISSIPYASIQPSLQEHALRRDTEKSKNFFSMAIVSFLFSFIILSICCIAIIPLLKLIKPTLTIEYSMFAVLLLNMVIYQMYHLCASFLSTFNTIPYTKAFILSSVATFAISYVLAAYTGFGVWSLILAPLIVSLVYNAWKWPREASAKVNTDFFHLLVNGGSVLKNKYLKKTRK